MEIQGKLIRILETQTGESSRGTWVRGGFVIETGDDYPRMVAFNMFGEDRLAMLQNLPMNCMVQVRFNPESREFNGRWYTDLRCTFVQQVMSGQPSASNTWQPQVTPQQPVAAPQSAFAQPPVASMPVENDNDLPF